MKEPETPELKALKEAVASKKAATAKLQRNYTALRKEANNSMNLIPNIERKSFPKEFCDHLRNNVNEVLVEAEAAARLYAVEIIKPEPKDPLVIEEVLADTANIVTHSAALEASLLKARRGIFADIKKNSDVAAK